MPFNITIEQLSQNKSENSPLKNSHGVLSTVNSKMSKRYMMNQLTESDSSIGEDIIQGKLLTKFML